MSASPPPLPLLLLLLVLTPHSALRLAEGFSTARRPAAVAFRCGVLRHRLRAVTSSSSDSDNGAAKRKGDALRDATGIRPSLHPTTINCVAEALLLRSKCVLGKTDGSEPVAIDTADPSVEPLQIAITAGGIAMSAIDQRKEAAKTDDTTDEFTMEESQTISGRVVGVVMRMRDLERLLVERANRVAWVRKYGEEGSFGVSKKECERCAAAEDGVDEAAERELAETINIDPLFRMNRAECLLALFLSTVEGPKLEMLGEDVAGGSGVDFIDADRLEVLLGA